MNSFVTTVNFQVKTDSWKEAQELLGAFERFIPSQPGCIYFQLHVPVKLNAVAQRRCENGNGEPGAFTHTLNMDGTVTVFKRDVWEDHEYFSRHSESEFVTRKLGKIFAISHGLPYFLPWERILSEANNGIPVTWNQYQNHSRELDDWQSRKALEKAGGDNAIIVVTHRSCRESTKPRFQSLLFQLATACRRTGLTDTYDVHASLEPSQPNLFMEYSIWNSVESFHLHLKEPLIKELRNEMHFLEADEPRVTFYKKFKFEDWKL
jgi:quinol monooxygenase YgiN